MSRDFSQARILDSWYDSGLIIFSLLGSFFFFKHVQISTRPGEEWFFHASPFFLFLSRYLGRNRDTHACTNTYANTRARVRASKARERKRRTRLERHDFDRDGRHVDRVSQQLSAYERDRLYLYAYRLPGSHSPSFSFTLPPLPPSLFRAASPTSMSRWTRVMYARIRAGPPLILRVHRRLRKRKQQPGSLVFTRDPLNTVWKHKACRKIFPTLYKHHPHARVSEY